MFFGGAFHAAYYFIAVPGVDAGGLNLIQEKALNDFRNHLHILSYLSIPGFVIGTFLLLTVYLPLSPLHEGDKGGTAHRKNSLFFPIS